jgi:mono/diheme cytochrome c family protein
MKNFRKLANGMAATVLFAAVLFITVRAHTDVQPSDTAAYYKSKCVACHGQKAEKKFDPSLPDEQLIDAILKGKKGEKPPNMPGYGAKGVSSDQAKALIAHMKELKAAQ